MLSEYSRTKFESLAQISTAMAEIQNFFLGDCFLLAHPVCRVSAIDKPVFVLFLAWQFGGRSIDVIRSINKVTLRRARLVLGWVTVFGRYIISVCNLPIRSTSSLHPFGVAKLSTSFNWLG